MDGDKATIPYIAHEGALARMERTTSKLFKVVAILIIALFLSNALWLWAWVQYDYADSDFETLDTVTVDAGNGTANYIGNDGDITNGADNGNTENPEKNPDTDTQK